jgi:hypothetical protein
MLAPDRASRLNAQALLAEFINDRQTLQLLAIGTAVKHKSVRPHLIRRRRHKRLTPVTAIYFKPSLRRYLKPCGGPDSGRSVSTNRHTIALQKDPNSARAKAWIQS